MADQAMKTVPRRPRKDGSAFLRVISYAAFSSQSGEEDLEFRIKWHRSWPSGTRYDVMAWDGGCIDRPTALASFADLAEAKEFRRIYNKSRRG